MSMRDSRSSDATIIFVFFAVVLGTIGASFLGAFAFWLYFAIGAVLCFVGNYNYVEPEHRQIYLFGFLAHVALLIYQSTMQNLPMSGGDWGVFVRRSRELLAVSDGFLEIINPFAGGYDAYERLCAVIYHMFEYDQKYMYFVSFIAAEVCFSYIYRTALLTSGDFKISSLTSLVFYLTPLEMIYSVDFLREMVIQMIFAISFFHFIQYLLYRKQSELFVAAFLTIILTIFHSGMVGVLIGYITVVMLYDRMENAIHFSLFRIASVLVIVFVLYNSPVWNIVAARFSNVDNIDTLLKRVDGAAVNTTYIGSPASISQLIMQIPIRFIYYLTSPLPWQVKSGGGLIAMLLDATVRWVVAFRTIKLLFDQKMRQFITSDDMVVLRACVIILVFTTLIFSWGTNNYGTAMRHRTSLYPMEVLVFISIWSRTNERRRDFEAADKESMGEV